MLTVFLVAFKTVVEEFECFATDTTPWMPIVHLGVPDTRAALELVIC